MTLLTPWFLLLLPLPMILHRLKRQRRENALEVPTALAAHWQQGARGKFKKQTVLYIIWALLVIASARPAKPEGTPIYPTQARDIVLALDLSASMEREDFSLNNQTASRIEVVRRVASDFVRRLDNERVGLVFFGDEAHIAAPLSFDVFANASFIEEARIGLAGRSTAIGDAIGQSIKVFDNKQRDSAPKIIILLSDGTNNAGAVSPTQAARFAKEFGIRIYSIGLASDEFTNSFGISRTANYDLDEETLKDVARSTDGLYFRARTSEELNAIYTKLAELERGEVEAPPLVRYSEFNWLFVVAALLMLLLMQGVAPSKRPSL